MKICIINTGGTISCVGTPLAPLPADRFAAAAHDLLMPSLKAALPQARLSFHPGLRFRPDGGDALDSTDLQPRDWCVMAKAVLDAYADHDAFVILHGTDSMDYSGAALSFLLNVFDAHGLGQALLTKSVILTGSQLPLFRATAEGLVLNAGSDALTNLAGAVRAATLRLPEVALFFDGRLLRANRALKVSSFRFAAFDSPHLPPLAEIGIGCRQGHTPPLPGPPSPGLGLDDPAARDLARDQLAAVARGLDEAAVVTLPAFPAGTTGSPLAGMINDAVAGGARAIVLRAYGEGNFPSGNPVAPRQGEVCAALMQARAAGVLVVDASGVIDGSVETFHYAAGAWLAEAGVIEAGEMTPIAAQAKTAILTAAAGHHGWDEDSLRALLRRSLAGECRPGDRLIPQVNPVLHPGQSLQAADGAGRLLNDPGRGLVLQGPDGSDAWAPAPGRPARLNLDPDGTLRLTAPDGATLWRRAGEPDQTGAVLLLRHEAGQVVLELRQAGGRATRVAQGGSGHGPASPSQI